MRKLRGPGPIRLALVAVLAAVAAAAVTVAPLLPWASERLTDAHLSQAHLVSDTVAATVERAMELGIPLDNENVVHSGFRYFGEILSDTPRVRFIAVASGTPPVDLVFYEGTNRRRLGALLSDATLAAVVGRGGTGDRPVVVGNFAILARSLTAPDAAPTMLYVGVDRRLAVETISEWWTPFAFGVLALAAFAFQAGAFGSAVLVGPPLARFAGRDRAAAKEELYSVAGGIGRSDIARAAHAGNLVIARVVDRMDRLEAQIDEAKEGIHDPDAARALARIHATRLAALRQRIAPKTRPVANGDWLRPALFALSSALAVAAPTDLPLDLAWLGTAALSFAVGVLLISGLTLPQSPAGLVAVAAFIALLGSGVPDAPLAIPVLGAFGLGVAAGGCARSGQRPVAAVSATLSGLVAGGAAAIAWPGTHLGAVGPWILAGSAVLAAAAAWSLAPRAPSQSQES